MPLSFSASYCFSFFTCALLPGTAMLLSDRDGGCPTVEVCPRFGFSTNADNRADAQLVSPSRTASRTR
jgi:hypothetical protein